MKHTCLGIGYILPLAVRIFFWCYLSSQLTELIDILHSEEIKISWGTRNVSGMTPGSLRAPGVSALIARVASGPSTVQNSLGRKWDMKLTKSAKHANCSRAAWPFLEASAAPRGTQDLGPVPFAQKKFSLP